VGVLGPVAAVQGRSEGAHVLQRPKVDVDARLVARRVDGGLGGRVFGVRHLEHHLHVVVGAGAAGPAVEVPLPRRRDEEVVLARVELQPSRCRTKRPKSDGELLLFTGFITDCNYAGIRLTDPTTIVLLLRHIVDDVLLQVLVPFSGGAPVPGADQIHLVVLPWHITLIDVHDVVGVVNPEDGVGRVPVQVVHPGGTGGGEGGQQADQHLHESSHHPPTKP